MFIVKFPNCSKQPFWRTNKDTLLALITPALNGVVFGDMALKEPALYIYLWEFEHEHLKNNANKCQRWRGRR